MVSLTFGRFIGVRRSGQDPSRELRGGQASDVRSFLFASLLHSQSSRLPCSISISVPFHVPCERKALNSLPPDALAKAKAQLMTAIEGMSVGDSVSVTTDFGSFQTILQIEGIDDGQDINFYSMAGSGLRGGIFDET